MSIDGETTEYGSRAGFVLSPHSWPDWDNNANVSYAILIDSAGLFSYTSGGDPWYLTERQLTNDTFDPDYRIRPGRPALSCWEHNNCIYRSQSVGSVLPLAKISDMESPLVLLDVLEAAFHAGLMIYNLGSPNGSSAIESQRTAARGVASVEDCKLFDNLEGLILASIVATMNIFSSAAITILQSCDRARWSPEGRSW